MRASEKGKGGEFMTSLFVWIAERGGGRKLLRKFWQARWWNSERWVSKGRKEQYKVGSCGEP